MYEILKELGSNARLARSGEDGRIYVLKKIDVGDIPLYKKLVSLQSPHLARLYETAAVEDGIYAVFEYVEGITLGEYIEKHGVLSEAEAARFTAELCDGLNLLHRLGIVHRDISPGNIIVCPGGAVKIIDFGIMRLEKPDKSADTQLLGTPGFAAPEQYGFGQSSAKADIYALGVLINYMLTAGTPAEKGAPGRFSKIISKCTQLDEANRYGNVQEVKNAVRRRTAINSAIRQIPGFRKGSRLHRLAACLYYFAALGFTGFALWASDSTRQLFMWLLTCIFALFLPVGILFNFRNYLEKFRLTKNSTRGDRAAFQVFLTALSLAIAFTALVFA